MREMIDSMPTPERIGVQVAELLVIRNALKAVPSLQVADRWGQGGQEVDRLANQVRRTYKPLEQFPLYGNLVLSELAEVMPVTATTTHDSPDHIRSQNEALAGAIIDQRYRVAYTHFPTRTPKAELVELLHDAALTTGAIKAGLMAPVWRRPDKRRWKPEVIAAAGFIRGDIDEAPDYELRLAKDQILEVVAKCAQRRPVVSGENSLYQDINATKVNKQGHIIDRNRISNGTKMDLFWKALRGDLMSLRALGRKLAQK